MIAVIILLAGVLSAAIVYWLGSRGRDYSDDPSMIGFNKSEERQMEILYGKQGQLIEDLNHSLKQPSTQAVLIAVAAAMAATVCFQFSRILEAEAVQEADNGGEGDMSTKE